VSRLAGHLQSVGHDVHLVLRENIINYDLHPAITVHILENWRTGGKITKVYKFRKRLGETVRRIDPDVSVAYTSLYGALLASTLVKPVIVRLDVYPLTLKKWKWALFLAFYNLPNVRSIVCLTTDTKTDLKPYFPERKLEVIHNAALPSGTLRSQASNTDISLTARDYFVSVGRLASTKGFDRSLRAYAMAEAYRYCDFVVVGDGVERASLEALVRELDIEQYVHFAGYQENPFGIVANALCLIHSSSREGFPNVFTEALSLGVPVVAMDCKTGPSEIIQQGRNGFLVPMNDLEAMAEKMKRILEDSSLLDRLHGQAEASVERFSEDKVFRRWEEVLSAK